MAISDQLDHITGTQDHIHIHHSLYRLSSNGSRHQERRAAPGGSMAPWHWSLMLPTGIYNPESREVVEHDQPGAGTRGNTGLL